ncbi:hypothetical protein H0H92_006104 [Tricholoma furcatifolium]|nr:hypothetical protein H0H92_006104 [Tricholoma furcatifolium]
MALAGGLLVILCTARFAIDTANVFEAFIKHEDRTSRIAYLEDVRAPLFTTKHSLLVGVLFVVSGSYTMWAYAHLPSQQILSESHWLTAFYVLSLVANAMSTSKAFVFTPVIRYMAEFSLLGLLAWRIYAARKEMHEIQPSTYTNEEGARNSHPGRMSLKPILHIILESGALNAAYLFVYTMTLVTGTEGLEVMSEMV